MSQKEEETQDNDGSIFSQITQDIISDSNNPYQQQQQHAPSKKINTDKWKDDDDEDNDAEIQQMLEQANQKAKLAASTLTQPDDDYVKRIAVNSTIPGVQIALGNFTLAFNYLRSQLGITSAFQTLKPIIKDIYMSSYTQFKLVPRLSPIEFTLRSSSSSASTLLPQTGITLSKLQLLLNKGYDAVSNFEMTEAQKAFRDVLHFALFAICSSAEEEKAIKDIIYICTEYIYLTKISLLAEDVKDKDKTKYCDLVCLMSVCKLEVNEHKFLIYKKAKNCCKSIKNFITGLGFIKKMLSLENEVVNVFGTKEFDKCRQELISYQTIATNQHQLDFNINETLPHIRSFYDPKSLKRVNVNEKVLVCPLCNAVSAGERKGEVCDVCNLCTLGEEVIGLKLREY